MIKNKKTSKKRQPKWNLSVNAVVIPYSQVPLAKMIRRSNWKNGVYDRDVKSNPYWCPVCHDSLSFERYWSKKPRKLEVLVPFCRNSCELDTKWISIAHQLRSKKPKRRKIARNQLDFEKIQF